VVLLKSNEFKTEFLYNSIEVYTKHKHNMAFRADKPFAMKIAYAIFPPNLRFTQAVLAAQKIVMHSLQASR
jgi:hypothetical protein